MCFILNLEIHHKNPNKKQQKSHVSLYCNKPKWHLTVSLLQARLSNIRHIQWWRPTASFLTEYGFATCISLPVSRLGLTGEERDQVTLMHHGCWRTHMRTPRHTLSHPISLSLSHSDTHMHTPLRELIPLYRSKAPPWPCVIVPLQPASSLLSVWANHLSPKILQPCTIAKGPAEVKQSQSSTFQIKLCVMRYAALSCDKIDW